MKFRTINNSKVKPSRRLIDTIHDMEFKQSWMKDYRINQNDGRKFELLHNLDTDMKVEDATAIVSRIIDLSVDKNVYSLSDDDYFNFLRDKMSHLNIMVMQSGIVGTNTHRSLNVDEFRAFVLIDEWVPLIFINSVDSKKAKIFSVVHEFVHILLGENEILNVSPNVDIANERWINSVTINVLMPEENVKRMIKSSYSKEDNIKRISNKFHVSLLATAIRMQELKIYGNAEVEWAKEMQSDGLKAKSKSAGGNYYNVAVSRLDKNFATAVINEESRGNTPVDTAANMLGITLRTYTTTVQEYSILYGLS